MKNNIFTKPENLLQYYEIQSDDFRMRHTAIWTEVQHYTWVLSLLLGAGPISAIGTSSLDSTQYALLSFMPAFGTIIALMAYQIIKRDFVYYTRADSRLLYIEKKLGVTLEKDFIDDRLTRALDKDFNVQNDIKSQLASPLRSIFKPRIRNLILGIFIAYIFAGILETAFFLILSFK